MPCPFIAQIALLERSAHERRVAPRQTFVSAIGRNQRIAGAGLAHAHLPIKIDHLGSNLASGECTCRVSPADNIYSDSRSGERVPPPARIESQHPTSAQRPRQVAFSDSTQMHPDSVPAAAISNDSEATSPFLGHNYPRTYTPALASAAKSGRGIDLNNAAFSRMLPPEESASVFKYPSQSLQCNSISDLRSVLFPSACGSAAAAALSAPLYATPAVVSTRVKLLDAEALVVPPPDRMEAQWRRAIGHADRRLEAIFDRRDYPPQARRRYDGRTGRASPGCEMRMDSGDDSDNSAIIDRFDDYLEFSETDDEVVGHVGRASDVAACFSKTHSSPLRARMKSQSTQSSPTNAIIRALAESPVIKDCIVNDGRERERGNRDSLSSLPVSVAAMRVSSASQTDRWSAPSPAALWHVHAQECVQQRRSPLPPEHGSLHVSPVESVGEATAVPKPVAVPPHAPVRHSLVSHFSHVLPSQPQLFSLPMPSNCQSRPQPVRFASETAAVTAAISTAAASTAAAAAAATAPRAQFESPAMRRLQDEIVAIRQLASRPALGAILYLNPRS